MANVSPKFQEWQKDLVKKKNVIGIAFFSTRDFQRRNALRFASRFFGRTGQDLLDKIDEIDVGARGRERGEGGGNRGRVEVRGDVFEGNIGLVRDGGRF